MFLRVVAILAVPLLLSAAEPEWLSQDSLLQDSLLNIELADTSQVRSKSLTSSWFFPLAVIGATAGMFVILFTARSK